MKNEYGVTIFIALLILSSIVILAIAVSDIVIRASRSSTSIVLSEVAYYSAEAGIEKALYQIEKMNSVTGINGSYGSMEEISDAVWECDLESVFSSNSFSVDLDSGESLQLELNFEDANSDLNYPSQLNFIWTGGQDVKANYLSFLNGTQETRESTFQLTNLSQNLYIVRISNNSSGSRGIHINATGGDVPIGIQVICTGRYKGEERIVEVQRNNWQVY
ncbi:MAG: hypothetical protein ABIF17_01910 [Patescibacteria group bacterium]